MKTHLYYCQVGEMITGVYQSACLVLRYEHKFNDIFRKF